MKTIIGPSLLSATLACGAAPQSHAISSHEFPAAGSFIGVLPYFSGTQPSCAAVDSNAITCCDAVFQATIEIADSNGTYSANNNFATKANDSLTWTEVAITASEGRIPDNRGFGCNAQKTTSGTFVKGGSVQLTIADVETCQADGDPNSSTTAKSCNYSGTVK